MENDRRYFTESCKTITTHATITDRYIPSVFTITITDGIYLSVFDRVLKYLPPMPQSLTDIPSVITVENTNGMIPSVMLSREIIFFCRASPSVRPLVVDFFYFR
jgi:hypothetical protein